MYFWSDQWWLCNLINWHRNLTLDWQCFTFIFFRVLQHFFWNGSFVISSCQWLYFAMWFSSCKQQNIKKLSSIQSKCFVTAFDKSCDILYWTKLVALLCDRVRCFELGSDIDRPIVHSASSDRNSLQNFTSSHEIDSICVVGEWSSCKYFSRLHFFQFFFGQHAFWKLEW